MTDLQTLLRLQTWLSPAFPTGAFSYSHGLEAAIENCTVSNAADLKQWLQTLVHSGTGWNDGVLLAQAWRDCEGANNINALIELATALCFSKERLKETTEQGGAFVKAAKAWGAKVDLPPDCPLPIALGVVAGKTKTELEATLSVFLHGFVSNQIQAALRLMPLGQEGGVKMLAELDEKFPALAKQLAGTTLDDLGSSTVMADIAAMKHGELQSRIFIT